MSSREPSVPPAGARPEHQIAPGVVGWLDSPQPFDVLRDCVFVSGWVFSRAAPLSELTVKGFGQPRRMLHGQKRDDVARVYADDKAGVSGFSAYLERDPGDTAAVHLQIWGRFEDGQERCLFERRYLRGAVAPGTSAGVRLWPLICFAIGSLVRNPRLALTRDTWRQGLITARRLLPRNAGTPAAPYSPSAHPAADVALRTFLRAGALLRVPQPASPVVSVILVLWNRAALTLSCLRALCGSTDVPFEIVIVDNASTDETPDLLTKLVGATVLRNVENLGFTVAANIGAEAARGEFLLFLNNDADLLPAAIERLVETIRRADRIAAVGGKLVFPDGRLQEAGSIIWSDGSCEGYGRGDDPSAPEFNFERDVDFCSAALLLTPRRLFESLGGFDERYRPAYYEDVDYCVRLWQAGYRVVYQPAAAAIHTEFGSAMSSMAGPALQMGRRAVFVSRHERWLVTQHSRSDGALTARTHDTGRLRVIVIDDGVPDPRLGAGFPRAAVLLQTLLQLGSLVTLYTTTRGQSGRLADGLTDVEVITGSPSELGRFLQSRRTSNLVIVSRPHNMRYVKVAVGSDLSEVGVPVVYDAEAIFALRELGRRALNGSPASHEEWQSAIDDETRLGRGCVAVLAVNAREQQHFIAAGMSRVLILSHAVRPTSDDESAFDARAGILFVGAFVTDSPNEDAALFLARDVVPALEHRAVRNIPVTIAGADIPAHVRAAGTAGISFESDVADLDLLYRQARVFVAPIRYAAGIPLKIIEAAAHGLPVVCTPLLADQLGWQDGVEVLTAEDADEFAGAIERLHQDPVLWHDLRQCAREAVARDFGHERFCATLKSVLELAAPVSASAKAVSLR